MSEMINNSDLRQEQLKAIIRSIHEGMDLEEAKKILRNSLIKYQLRK